eukprot:CAMPEP_0176369576 /NCGR_PEP_ID=MMETSP0126-20121128/23385_1 /TAXON_ID=141414 ORGANISM="Strombidinopsis acuminatum, Strain SPMC142" /NCGR_SAMPLE_ID=MMETSP0126 /ASSEMBLY_ACC=CAM_ASM_000229 /LENGTH=313 /DNA_ID=CAMNT_0017728269 /DNA_START=14 /DNA_END=955 /DNA_ORIENTATION=-
MPGYFYDDILRSADGRTGVDVYADPTKSDPFKWFNLVVKAAPRKGCSISNTFTKQKEVNDDGSEKWSEKSAFKLGYTHDGMKWAFGFANDKYTFGLNSELYKDGDMTVKGDFASEHKPAKGERKATVSFDLSSPDLGGARAFKNFSVEVNSKQEKTIKGKINVRAQDEYNVGASVEHDTKDFKKVLTQFVWNAANADVFARADFKRNLAHLGCAHTRHDDVHHVYEFTYGWGEGFKGIKGHPVEFRFGGEYELSDKTNLSTNVNVNEHCSVNQSVEHKINDKLTTTVNQEFTTENIGSKKPVYEIGFNVEYKL